MLSWITLFARVWRTGPTSFGESSPGTIPSETDLTNRFEAFDEPWKEQLNEPGKEWEDKWGLMDLARNLKPGVKIPDCGGKTIDSR